VLPPVGVGVVCPLVSYKAMAATTATMANVWNIAHATPAAVDPAEH